MKKIILISVLSLFMNSCGSDGEEILSFSDMKVTKVTVTGSVDTASEVTFLKLDNTSGADDDIDPLLFELPINLDGIDLIQDSGNASTITNTIKINTLNDLEVNPDDDDKGLVEISLILSPRD